MFANFWPKKGTKGRPSSRNIEIITTYPLTSPTSSEVSRSNDSSQRKAVRTVIAGRSDIRSVAFVADGKHMVSGDDAGKIRRWNIGNGEKVGKAMDVGSAVPAIAVSRDGRWLVGGTWSGLVIVWNMVDRRPSTKFRAHTRCVNAVDFSPDGTKIVTGSHDSTANVWLLETGERLFGPLVHDNWVVAAKFSPGDGTRMATAAWQRESIRVYDGHNGHLLFIVPAKVNSLWNQSLSWATHGNRLFALSSDGTIHCLDPSNGPDALSKWSIHSSINARCIALETTGTVIAASAGSSISFWDITTHKQVGSVINYTHDVWSMAFSDKNDLVVCGEKSITLTVPCDDPCQASSVTLGKLPGRAEADLLPFGSRQLETLREIIASLRADLRTLERGPDQQPPDLDENVREPLPSSECTITQKDDCIEECMSSLRTVIRARDAYYNNRITSLEQTNQHSNSKITSLEETDEELRVQLAQSQAKTDLFIRINRVHESRHTCESFYSRDRICDAAQSFLEMVSMVTEDIRANMLITDWLEEFSHRCITALENVMIGDEASDVDKRDEASLSSSTPNIVVLTKWARLMLINGSAEDALNGASKFRVPRFTVYRIICCILEDRDQLREAADCFCRLQNELAEDDSEGHSDERAQWEHGFRGRCAALAEQLGDTARDSKNHAEAIAHYSTALKFNPINFNDVLLKRSDEIIELDPSSHRGWEGKHAALHAMGRYSDAFDAFGVMFSKLAQSSDPQVCELRHQYVDATSAIREVVEETIRDMPRVLIDTATGHLCDKAKQAAAFEELPSYDQLRSSMTTALDYARIRTEVEKFYHYVMLSHKWQSSEPTFQIVLDTAVYELGDSTACRKLRDFCTLVRVLGFKWAWSDTCCVDQLDKAVQQESLVAMFRWYRGSSLTVVHLLGVSSGSQRIGCLRMSIWNTRGWTYQEYLASKVVKFYTEDWKPYLGLDIFNHKESPIILSEMEQAMNFETKELATLQPGLNRAREKLYLASGRHTTREEDMAYSLFGIFNVTLPVIYGEGDQAVGRLLEHIVTRSDDVILLAWTGHSGSHHSYLPSSITVYNEIVPPHLPASIETDKMNGMVTALRSSLPDLSLTEAMYERFYKLTPLSLDAGRLRLHCIIFPLVDVARLSEPDTDSDTPTYRAASSMLGDVTIRTKDELSGLEGASLIHPWIGPLLDQDFSYDRPLSDLTTRALRFFVRLRQPFGALLLVPVARAQYKRIATDCLIEVQVRAEIPLTDLVDGISTIDIQ